MLGVKIPGSDTPAPSGTPAGGKTEILNTEVSTDLSIFRQYLLKGARERTREAANHGMMDGTYYRQWLLDNGSLSRMVAEGRAPTSINIIKNPINLIVGSVIMEKHEAVFDSKYGRNPMEAIAAEEIYLEDQELPDRDHRTWKHEAMLALRDGFIYRGWLRARRDYHARPLGGVAWSHIPPDRVVSDPNWVTTNINDNENIFTFTYMTAKRIQMVKKWMGTKRGPNGDSVDMSSLVRQAVERDRMGTSGAPENVILPFDNSPDMMNEVDGSYLVINKYWIEQRTEYGVFDLEKQEFIENIPVEKREEHVRMAKAVGRALELVPRERLYEKMRTFCPAISTGVSLEEGYSGLQIGGYGFVAWSCDHLMGHPNTPVDQLTDPQRTINKRESWITAILPLSSVSAMLMEEGIASPAQKRAIEEGGATPGAKFWVKDGALSGRRVTPIPNAAAPNNFMAASDQILKIAKNDLTPATPPMAGISQSGDSGLLLQTQIAQSLVSLAVNKEFLQRFLNEMNNKWFEGSRQTYTYPMVVNGKKNQVVLHLNVEGGIIYPSVSLKSITVEESPNSQTRKTQMLRTYASVMNYIPGPATKQRVSMAMVKNVEGVPAEDLKAILATAQLELEKMEADLKAGIKQASAPPQAPGAAPGEGGIPGAPVGGVPMNTGSPPAVAV